MERIRKKKWFAAAIATGLLAGLIAGAGAMSCLMAYRIDKYLLKIGTLENMLEDRESRLKSLEGSINSSGKKKYILKEIEAVVAYEGDDEIGMVEVKKHIEEKYRQFVGKEVAKIDMELASEVIDKRIFVTSGGKYRLHVEKLLLSEVLKIWVKVSPLDE